MMPRPDYQTEGYVGMIISRRLQSLKGLTTKEIIDSS